jgi:DNA-binding PadR family transcriptional regulator
VYDRSVAPSSSRRKVSNPLALAVLALLAERPMHPYEMGTTLRERNKEASIKLNYGSLYTVVDSLRRAGFVLPRETVRESRRPERTVFEITPAGQAELHEWLGDLLSTPRKEFRDFEAALALMPILPPGEVVPLLRRRLTVLEEQNRGTREGIEAAAEQGVDRLFLVEEEYRLMLSESEREWVARLVDRLEDPGYGQLWRQFHEAAP